MDEKEIKFKNLISLRNNYFTLLFLTTSGSVGLVLTKMTRLIEWVLLSIGFLLIISTVNLIRKKSKEIEKMAGENK